MDAHAKQVKNTYINKQIFQNEFAKKLTRLSHSNNNNSINHNDSNKCNNNNDKCAWQVVGHITIS